MEFKEFLRDYLAYSERKESRGGASRWVITAAAAVVCWELLGVFGGVSFKDALPLLSVVLSLYMLMEVLDQSGKEAGLMPKGRIYFVAHKRSAATRRHVFSIIRFILTAGLAIYYTWSADTHALIFIFVLIGYAIYLALVVGGCAVALDLNRDYYAAAAKLTPRESLIGKLVVGVPLAVILYVIISANGMLSGGIKYGANEVKFVSLVCAIIYLIDAYLAAMSTAGESKYVSQLWKRYGMSEIGDFEAKKELGLIIVGVRLRELVGTDLDKFFTACSEVEAQIRVAANEVLEAADERLADSVRNAVINSARQRISSSVALIEALSKRYDDLSVTCKGYVGDNSDVKGDLNSLVKEAGDRFEQVKAYRDRVEESLPR